MYILTVLDNKTWMTITFWHFNIWPVLTSRLNRVFKTTYRRHRLDLFHISCVEGLFPRGKRSALCSPGPVGLTLPKSIKMSTLRVVFTIFCPYLLLAPSRNIQLPLKYGYKKMFHRVKERNFLLHLFITLWFCTPIFTLTPIKSCFLYLLSTAFFVVLLSSPQASVLLPF